ncbi:hypothetical protein R5W23_002278 [Gemmata sp. JC673]|uniref:Uncharacterized protein n=1 Tax=Gemmata algarum TaxID=2975278 RepID=A0ABU5F1F7_9BACT|nr:hypothetical protein [Gemmata algarum]MDY3561019.1 hypothetical protein [Gemmata algarum]
MNVVRHHRERVQNPLAMGRGLSELIGERVRLRPIDADARPFHLVDGRTPQAREVGVAGRAGAVVFQPNDILGVLGPPIPYT